MSDQSVVGDLTNLRGLVYSPINEQGVVFLFGKIAQEIIDDLEATMEQLATIAEDLKK